MKIKIEIDCETIQEFKQHLQMIKLQTDQKAKKLKLSEADEFPVMVFEHDNCYGAHTVEILREVPALFEAKKVPCEKCPGKSVPGFNCAIDCRNLVPRI